MKRRILLLVALATALCVLPTDLLAAGGGRGRVGIRSRGGPTFTGGFGLGRGVGFGLSNGIDGYSDIYGLAELYRELYNNLPYFSLHPPVYYSYPVPRTYGYSPFAYPGDVMTPEIIEPVQPVTIINPHVKSNAEPAAKAAQDKAAAVAPQIQPLVIYNPFVTPRNVAQAE